jgi:hypothetical protein
MRLRRPHNLGGKLTTGVAILVLLLILGSVVLYTVGLSSDSESSGSSGVSRTGVPALELGTTRQEVEAQLGRGRDALEYIDTGVALEPMDAECLYYPQTPGVVMQLCFRDDLLVRKQTNRDPPQAP